MKTPAKQIPATFGFVLFAGIIAMSTSALFIRYALEEADPIAIAALRLTVASIILLPIAWIRNRAELRSMSKREVGLGMASGAFLAIHFAAWISSLEYTSVASSVVLVQTNPLWVAIFSPLLLKEPISKWIKIGIGLSLTGAVIIGAADACAQPSGFNCPPVSSFIGGDVFLGDALALTGAIAGAAYIIIGRNLRAKFSLISYIFVVYGFSAIFLMAFATLRGTPMVGFSTQTYGWIVLLAILPQLVGHSSVNWALEYLPAAFVSIVLLSEPIGATILALIFLEEVPSPIKLIGAILILGGILIASRPDSNNPPESDKILVE